MSQVFAVSLKPGAGGPLLAGARRAARAGHVATGLALLLGALAVWTLGACAGEPVRAQPAADAAGLTRLIDGFLADEAAARPGPRGRALLVPQVSDADTGGVAGKAFRHLATDIDRVVLVGLRATDSATPPAGGLALPAWESMRTALGEVKVDTAAVQACRQRMSLASRAGDPAPAERAMASVLPFLQRRLPRPFLLLPLIVDAAADPAQVVALLKPLLSEERTALVVITAPPFGPAEFDAAFAATAGAAPAAPRALPAPVTALRSLAADMGWKATATGHGRTGTGLACVSAVLTDDPNRVDLLADAAMVSWDDPATAAAFRDAGRAAGRPDFQGDALSQPEQELLLGLARKAIYCKLKEEPPPAIPLYSDTLSRPAGCFVTLTLGGKLRGSLGTPLAKEPLAATVARYAPAAALEGKRFPPVTLKELPDIEIRLSVPTVPAKAEFRDGADLLGKLKPRVHGVLLTYEGGKRANFLPQVWAQFPEPATFLTALCRKAGIPDEAWKDPSKTTIELYESFDFAEKPR
jgi:MEMO1 family protein